MKMLSIVRVTLLAIGATLCASPSTVVSQHPTRPNVLLIVSDDQRPDTIGALGNAAIRTPHLDRLVRGGTAFVRAVSPNPICTPARAEIMTGCSGFRNGVVDFGGKIAAGLPLWGETMRAAGYRTGHVGKWHNDGTPHEAGYEQTRGWFASGGGRWQIPTFDSKGRPVTGYRGWLFRDDDGTPQPQRGVGLSPNISESFADAAIELIREESDQPFFVHVNFTAPHDPLLVPFGFESAYDPGEIPLSKNFLAEHPFDHGNLRGRDEQLLSWPRTPETIQEELAAYYAVISHMDGQIGRILDALQQAGAADETLVIFTSDHGLAVGSHGLRGKQSMYEHTIGVPLVFSGPGIPKNARSQAQCYLRDLYPTVCELCGIDVPDVLEGRSLAPVLAGKSESVHSTVFGYYRQFQRMIRTDEWKLIDYPKANRRQLFHLPSDPHEMRDLADDAAHAPMLDELQQRLRRWQRSVHDSALRTE